MTTDVINTTQRRQIQGRDWLIAASLAMVTAICAVLIGTHRIKVGHAAIILVPFVWAILIGSFFGIQRWRPVSPTVRGVTNLLINIGIVLFLARLGTQIGPALTKLQETGLAIMLQEVGHVFGTVIFALPVAVAFGLGRVAIGAAWSIDRESYLAYAIQKFGIRSPEYRGVFSVWILGTIFGALFISLLAGIVGGLGWFDPRALAMGLGLGSASMMLGGVAALSVIYPEYAAEITALAALSNLLTNIVGFYAGVFIALPMCRKLYAFWTKVFHKEDIDELHRLESEAARPVVGQAQVESADADPVVRRTWGNYLLAYGIVFLMTIVANVLQTRALRWQDLVGMVILLGLTYLALKAAELVPSVPGAVWVMATATLLTAPFFPGSGWILEMVGTLDAFMVGLSSIALIGLTVGRDVAALRQVSWKIVIVALITYSASFLAAAAIADWALHL